MKWLYQLKKTLLLVLALLLSLTLIMYMNVSLKAEGDTLEIIQTYVDYDDTQTIAKIVFDLDSVSEQIQLNEISINPSEIIYERQTFMESTLSYEVNENKDYIFFISYIDINDEEQKLQETFLQVKVDGIVGEEIVDDTLVLEESLKENQEIVISDNDMMDDLVVNDLVFSGSANYYIEHEGSYVEIEDQSYFESDDSLHAILKLEKLDGERWSNSLLDLKINSFYQEGSERFNLKDTIQKVKVLNTTKTIEELTTSDFVEGVAYDENLGTYNLKQYEEGSVYLEIVFKANKLQEDFMFGLEFMLEDINGNSQEFLLMSDVVEVPTRKVTTLATGDQAYITVRHYYVDVLGVIGLPITQTINTYPSTAGTKTGGAIRVGDVLNVYDFADLVDNGITYKVNTSDSNITNGGVVVNASSTLSLGKTAVNIYYDASLLNYVVIPKKIDLIKAGGIDAAHAGKKTEVAMSGALINLRYKVYVDSGVLLTSNESDDTYPVYFHRLDKTMYGTKSDSYVELGTLSYTNGTITIWPNIERKVAEKKGIYKGTVKFYFRLDLL